MVILSRGDPGILLMLEPNPGDVLLLIAVGFTALHNVLLRRVPTQISVPMLLVVIQLLGAIVTLPLYVAESVFYMPVPVTWQSVSDQIGRASCRERVCQYV